MLVRNVLLALCLFLVLGFLYYSAWKLHLLRWEDSSKCGAGGPGGRGLWRGQPGRCLGRNRGHAPQTPVWDPSRTAPSSLWLLILSTKRLRGVGFRPLLTHLSLSHPTVPFRNPHLPPLLPAVICQLPGIQTLCLAPDPLKPKETFDLTRYNLRIVQGGNAAGGFGCSGIGIMLSFDCSVSASSSACANCLQARIIFFEIQKQENNSLFSPSCPKYNPAFSAAAPWVVSDVSQPTHALDRRLGSSDPEGLGLCPTAATTPILLPCIAFLGMLLEAPAAMPNKLDGIFLPLHAPYLLLHALRSCV